MHRRHWEYHHCNRWDVVVVVAVLAALLLKVTSKQLWVEIEELVRTRRTTTVEAAMAIVVAEVDALVVAVVAIWGTAIEIALVGWQHSVKTTAVKVQYD